MDTVQKDQEKNEKVFPPLLTQYFEIQSQYPEAIILMEVGSFFEVYGYQNLGYPRKFSQLLDITLTKKDKADEDSADMAGFPSITLNDNLKKLVELGETIVLVTQTEIVNEKGKRAFTRKIEKIISPGSIVENLSADKSNYFACVYEDKTSVGVALVDVSTGDVKISELTREDLEDFLNKVQPAEILICGSIQLNSNQYKTVSIKKNIEINKINSCGTVLAHVYEIDGPTSNPTFSISVLGLEKWRLGTLALSNLINHFSATDYNSALLKKLSKPKIYNGIQNLMIPLNGLRSLEIFDPQSLDHKESLLYVLDKCKTAMGHRKLRDWMTYPLIDINEIYQRYDKVDEFILKNQFYTEMKDIYDIQRLSRRMLVGRLFPHEVDHFISSCRISLNILKLEDETINYTKLKTIIEFLEKNLDIDNIGKVGGNHGFTFFKGLLYDKVKVYAEKLIKVEEQAKSVITDLENRIIPLYAQIKKGILEDDLELESQPSTDSLQMGSKKILRVEKKKDSFKLVGPKGLYKLAKTIKMSDKKTSVDITTTEWLKISEEWFNKESRYNSVCQKEWEEFQKEFVMQFGNDIFEIADKIAEIDVLTNFAKISLERDYIRPDLLDSSHAYFDFKNLRHPIVEESSFLIEDFVPNDISLDKFKDIMCIYGANSAGKSTLLKSIAVNIIMAQIGCFISAAKGSCLSPFEAILTRMTTFDSLAEGLSTFTMEMKELQISLKYKKKKTLFLFDEIGRGTSVDDGEALAYATLDYLSSQDNNSVTFFATHYHNLVPNISNFNNILIKHLDCVLLPNNKIKFSRKLTDGPGDGSYGIIVAASCGIPDSLIRSAQNYNKVFAPLKKSRYNTKIEGIICPFCETEPVQETHHIIDQKQGTVESIIVNGIKKSINHPSNLIMICGSCHNKITRGLLVLNTKREL